ncbi:MAG TPA: hypothetical protein PKO06_13820, partial [Candidatus Ozemobacteraceae bacterium]|nr:hypothetical protein [Candidatus Ozemobacteraceae bacterium]
MESINTSSFVQTSASGDTPSAEPAAGTGLRWLWGLFLALLVLPALFFLSILRDVARDEEQRQLRELVHRADRLLTGIERELPPLTALNAFAARLIRDVPVRQCDETIRNRLEQLIRRRLHTSVQLLWFDSQGRAMNPGAPGFGGGQTVWAAFWRLLQNLDTVTDRDRFLARNLVLSYMGRIMPTEILLTAVDAVISLYFSGEPSYFTLLRFRDEKGVVQISCFLILNRNQLPDDWYIRRVLRRVRHSTLQAGAWRFSRQQEITPSALEPNVLPVLASRLLLGEFESVIGEDLYVSRISGADPDLMLSVRVTGGSRVTLSGKLLRWWFPMLLLL